MTKIVVSLRSFSFQIDPQESSGEKNATKAIGDKVKLWLIILLCVFVSWWRDRFAVNEIDNVQTLGEQTCKN